MNITHYAKSIGQVLAAGLIILVAALSDGKLAPVELVNIVIAVVTAAGVYVVPNLASGVGGYAKAIVSVVGAALAALSLVLSPGLGFGQVSLADWLTVVLAGLAAIGIGIVPNAPKIDAGTAGEGPSKITAL